MEKKIDLAHKYDLYIIVLMIIISLSGLIYFASNNYERNIADLKNINSGTYLITGIISNLNQNDNRTTFIIADKSDFIESIIFETVDLNNGNLISAKCQISEYNNKKQCIIKDIKTIS